MAHLPHRSLLFANQAVAFANMSRSISTRLSFLRNSISSCRSLALKEVTLDIAAEAIAWLDLMGTPAARHQVCIEV
ncbi:hypothetical protein [uncultured Nitrosomonas sp.]|uniref:hypothetical protein n=1 Tax=uncultured Nitrosomonas sp. TaxID=156424 RepID=UPI0025F73F38|nr:hypothetical protein [uncultured Nitrosomonas sp.]